MANRKITDEDVKAIDAGFKGWGEFSNVIVSVLCLNMAFSIFSTPCPGISGVVALLFVVCTLWYARNHFMSKRLLKHEEKKDELDAVSRYALDGIYSKNFWLNSVRHHWLGMIGFSILGIYAIYAANKFPVISCLAG